MVKTQQKAPDIGEKFTEPEGWRWHSFTREGRKIRFGSVFPKDSIPNAVVLCLPGLSEFGEKYFEVARTCLDMNLAFWVIDWMGQGRSARYLKDPQKRHGEDFQKDVEDLHYFYVEYVKHSCVHPDVGRIPLAMLAHSMGGTIGLQYLHEHPDIFECAVFSAPMFGMQATDHLPIPVLHTAAGLLGTIHSKGYVKGGSAWEKSMRPADGEDALSCDPDRAELHANWFESDPELQVGSPTYGWLRHALKACAKINDPEFLKAIKTPCLIAVAGKESVVENDKIRSAAEHLENTEIIELPDARHEILMEKDEIRDSFFKAFYALIKERIIDRPETLKPF